MRTIAMLYPYVVLKIIVNFKTNRAIARALLKYYVLLCVLLIFRDYVEICNSSVDKHELICCTIEIHVSYWCLSQNIIIIIINGKSNSKSNSST